MTATAERVELQIASGFGLPLDLVTEATAIVATRGAGKSSGSAVIVEEAFGLGVQTVVFDRTGVYWGLRSNAKGTGPGLGIYVLGGPHGDVPLEPHAGALIADLVVDSGHSFVLDLSDFSKGQAVRFAADFLEQIYDRKARARTTTLIVMDEAHFYAPQTPRGGFKGDAARLMGAMEDVVGLGRSRGLGVILTTQRTQSLNKAVLDLIETLFVMRMLSPRAREAVKGWIQEKHEDDEHGVFATLNSLPDGTAWVWSPLRGILEKVALRRIKTFNSFATPKVGETQTEPAVRKELDLAALGEQMRTTAERAKENDPSELRKRVAALESELAAAKSAPVQRPIPNDEDEPVWAAHLREQGWLPPGEQPEPVRVEVPVATIADLDAIWKLVTTAKTTGDALVEGLREVAQPLASAIMQAVEAAEAPAKASPPPESMDGIVADARKRVQRLHDRPAPQRGEAPAAPPEAATGAPKVELNRRAERAILAVLAQFPQGRTLKQVAIMSGYAAKGGGFRGALSKLRTHGLIEGSSDLRITEAGKVAIAGQWEPLPTGQGLLGYWLAQMKRAAERAVLQSVYDAYPNPISAADVAAATDYEAAGGGFRGAISKLRTLGLIEGGGDSLRAADSLFE